MALTFMIGMLLARLLGPESYGIYALAMAVTSLAGMLTEFGLPILAMREAASAEANGQWGRLRGLLIWSNKIIIGISLLVLGGFFITAMIYDFSARSQFLGTMLWAILLIPVVALGKLRGLTLLSLGKTFIGQFPVLILRPGLFASAMAIAWFAGIKLRPDIAMMLQVGAATIALIAIFIFFRRYQPQALRTSIPIMMPRAWLSACVPMGMTEGLRLLQGQTAILLLGWMATSADVGLFRVADATASICLIPSTILNVVASPIFSKLHTAGSKIELQKILSLVTMAIIVGCLTLALPFILFSSSILPLAFGVKFTASNTSLIILLVGGILTMLLGPTATFSNMIGREKMVTISMFVSVLIQLLIGSLLINIYGPIGGPIGIVISQISANLILAIDIRIHSSLDSTVLSLRHIKWNGILNAIK